MEFRIEKIDDRGEITGALVFSPAPATGAAPRFSIERFGRENNLLGPHGWTVNAPPLAPRAAELRGGELWLLFGSEVSYWIDPGTAVLVRLAGTEVEGSDVWPPIPHGKAPPVPPRAEAPPPEPARAGPAAAPPSGPEHDAAPAPAPEQRPPPPSPAPTPPPRLPIETGDRDTGRGSGGTTGGVTTGGARIRRSEWLTVVVALLLGLGAAAAWWFWPQPEPAPQPPAAAVDPPSPPAPPQAADPCLDVDQVLDGACPRERLRELTPDEAVRLARALVERGGRTANDLAVSLLVGTVARSGHGEAALVLARLYDPHGFRDGGPLSAPNRGRALDLYRQAVAGGAAGAQAALDAFLARLRVEAEGGGPAAAEAAELLRRGGGG